MGGACDGQRKTETVSGADGGDGDEEVDVCKVRDTEEDGVPSCSDTAPPGSFEPEVQWVWTGPGGEAYSIVSPLVANMTDDNADGAIDLCDTPDVLVVASNGVAGPGHIYLLDGATGVQELMFETMVDGSVTPALGDIDGDGMVEVVTVEPSGMFIAFEHDGTVKWSNIAAWPGGAAYSGAIALADIDQDGDVEIIAGNIVLDHLGTMLWQAPQPAGNWSATAVADLDGDGPMEIILGHAAYHHDGTEYYVAPISPGYPQVADLDGDSLPEILVTNINGIALLEHDGTVVYQDLRPTGDPAVSQHWLRPATIHDFDGDGQPEFAVSSANHYTVYEHDASIVWSATVSDQSGIAAGTAFDFLGDGIAEAMYADETQMFVFDGQGVPLLTMPRTSGTLSEYPVVADIDNDGSAEIVVVSNGWTTETTPTVQVIRDREDRWIQARRIWNQHTYHVTNVREDGTIPPIEREHWRLLNTFRTNAQIGDGGVCEPSID
jgi:hypothetical protein